MVGHSLVGALRRGHLGLASLAVVLVAGLTVACSPTTTSTNPTTTTAPSAPIPIDIEQQTDAQVNTELAAEAAEVQAAYTDPAVLADIPAAQKASVLAEVADLSTAAGRAALIPQLRTAAYGKKRGLPQRAERTLGGADDAVAGAPPSGAIRDDTQMTREPAPTTLATGVNINYGSLSTAPCRAPGGVGSLPAPTAATTGGELITPTHDVFATPTGGTSVLDPGHLVASGANAIAGIDSPATPGPGIEFRYGTGAQPQQMHVQINLQDPKNFGPTALYPMIDIVPIGGTTADEQRATIVDGQIYCYAGDTNANRGYFDGWITIPKAEPGFQVIDEVVQNAYYFRPKGPNYQASLYTSAPKYFAGSDRSTVHVGPAPVTTSGYIPNSVGAFANSTADGSASSVPNVLTDTNGQPADDLEQYIRAIIDDTIRDKVDGALAGDIAQLGFFTAQASLDSPIQTSEDLRFTTPQDGFTVTDEPAGATGAVHADIGVTANADLYTQLLGVPCFGMTATITANVTANAWADASGSATGVTPRLRYNRDVDANFDMPTLDWLDPTCVISFGLGPHAAEVAIKSSIDMGIYGTFLPVAEPACFEDPTLFTPSGALVHPEDPLPARCLGPEGSFQKLLDGFNLNNYLPSVTLGSATLQPYVTNLRNSWCAASGAPAGCTSSQDLIGKDGLDVMADANMTLGGALNGLPLGGRFPNVFAPTTTSSVADLTTSHVDGNLTKAGLGIVLDPRLLNVALRDLMQGSNRDTTTNGILDVAPTQLAPGVFVSTRPEVAPEVIGLPPAGTSPACQDTCVQPPPVSAPLATIVLPDLRVSFTTSPGQTVVFSVSVLVQAGAQFDASTGKLRPLLQSAVADIQVISGCEADYTSGYALSYALCGRGVGGTGVNAPTTLTGVIDYLLNTVLFPILTNSIGGVALPSLASIVPSIGLDLTNVRFADRGGFLGVYADMKPAPSLSIAVSPSGLGYPTDDLRFFPSTLNINPPFSLAWAIRDGTTGAILKTIHDPNDFDAVEAPLSSFTTVTRPDGTIIKTADASLTLTQPNLQISATKSYTWYPPGPPPATGCLTGASAGQAQPAAAPTTVPGPGIQPSGC